MEHFDLIVVGAGPSGASAAFHAAEGGLKTAILEKEFLPRYKICGGGLVYRGRKMLPFDISEAVEREFDTVDIYFTGTDIHMQPKRDKPIISMVMRDVFDQKLVSEAEKRGVQVIQGQGITGIDFQENIIVETTEGKYSAKYVIAADGVFSPTAKLAGWDKETRRLIPALEYEVKVNDADFERLSKEVRFDVDFVKDGYAWSFPKNGHLSLGVGTLRKQKINLKEIYANYVKFLGIEEVLEEKAYGYQIPLSPRTDGLVRKNVILTGDAAGFADPLTAEGISNSIYSGRLAGEAVVEAHNSNQEVEPIYEHKLSEKLLPELKTVDFLQNLFINKQKIRMFFIKKTGNRYGEYMTDIFMGDKSYPKDLVKTLKKKIKDAVLPF